MRLTQHLTVLYPNEQQLSASSVETRRAPSRHCSDSRANGHTTTAVQDVSTPPTSKPSPHLPAAPHTSSTFRRGKGSSTLVHPVSPSPGGFHTTFSATPPPPILLLTSPSTPLPSLYKSSSQAVLIRVQLTLDCDPPNTSRRFALGASNGCLVGGNPTCSVPALKGCEGLWSYDYCHT